MKKIILSLSLLLAVPQLRAEPFTYQGKLENAGSPYTGTVTVTLGLFTTATGGVATRTQSFPGTTVTNGVFSVTATSFQAADFNGTSRYLEISVNDGVTNTTLAPRQEVTWAAMAMHAKKAETVTGSVPAAQITGTLNPSILSNGTTNSAITFGNGGAAFSSLVGVAPFTVSNSTKVTNLNSDLLDGLSSTDFLRRNGDTMIGDLNITEPSILGFPASATSARQMINLWGTQYGIGIQADTLYQRTNNDFSWHQGGTHSNARNSPGGGTEAMRLMAASSTLWLRPGTSSTPRGRILFGDLNSSNSNPYVSIAEAADDDDTLDITAEKIRLFSNSGGPASIHFGQNLGQALTFFQNATENFGIGVQGFTHYFRTSDQFSWYKGGSHAPFRGEPGPGGTTLMTLDSGGNLTLTGQLSTTVLTIRGGADVAEPFEMTKPDEMEPGTVVVIDEENPGHLKESTENYDTRVAGIISGAGGVKPGLRLHQEGVMEGDHHVALSGRVYVKSDAGFGKIKPGDLLTTSSTPGHAMRVKDHTKAQGAILGKAMSRLDEGTGLVLVLVTLQ